MDNATPESADTSDPRTGPGRLLRQARQDLRLAPEDVAQILHLSSKQITALEADDFQSLPGPTYVRGYLRGYAQLLGLSPEKVVEIYNQPYDSCQADIAAAIGAAAASDQQRPCGQGGQSGRGGGSAGTGLPVVAER